MLKAQNHYFAKHAQPQTEKPCAYKKKSVIAIAYHQSQSMTIFLEMIVALIRAVGVKSVVERGRKQWSSLSNRQSHKECGLAFSKHRPHPWQ